MIPAEVLNKAGQLNDEEWTLMRHHPSAGVELLADIEFPWDVRPIVESHHERWDGTGYPHGLAGDAIPLVARVVCIADVYDALTSRRSYKEPFTHEHALEVMRAQVGRGFDPELFAQFEALAEQERWAASSDPATSVDDDAPAARPMTTATS
jgi:HD-GYP domain-containing protein (c-di-GMP phosphodiesterase class II)